MTVTTNLDGCGNNYQTKRFYELLYYNLRFRDFTAKSLELAIEAFMFGISVG